MMVLVALIQKVETELTAVVILRPNARRAKVTTMLRFGGGLHLVDGRVVIGAELDSTAAVRGLRTYIYNPYPSDPDLLVISATGLRRATRYAVRVIHSGEALTRLTGLVDQRHRPVRNLPTVVVSGSIADSIAVQRGTLLAQGSLTEPGWPMTLEVIYPGSEAALTLSSAARRLDITVRSRESCGIDHVVLWDGEAVADPLTRTGAQETRLIQEECRTRCEVKTQTNRLVNFDDANLWRFARMAVTVSAWVERALEILGEDVLVHLMAAGRLRVEHHQASLEKLGKLHGPPLTKDVMAGRIRRLLTTADKVTEAAGIPNTKASLLVDLSGSQ